MGGGPHPVLLHLGEPPRNTLRQRNLLGVVGHLHSRRQRKMGACGPLCWRPGIGTSRIKTIRARARAERGALTLATMPTKLAGQGYGRLGGSRVSVTSNVSLEERVRGRHSTAGTLAPTSTGLLLRLGLPYLAASRGAPSKLGHQCIRGLANQWPRLPGRHVSTMRSI